jgi:predicted DNA-binding protein (UPF0251 family)
MSIGASKVNAISKSKAFRELPHVYVSEENLEAFSLQHWSTGITYKDLMKRFEIRKSHAQDTLNRALRKILFTIKRQRPQKYNPVSALKSC